jgi:hypothetical protein
LTAKTGFVDTAFVDPTELLKAKDCLDNPAYMARSQEFNLADNFKAVITTAAWRSKPSWMLVAAVGRTINPDLERWRIYPKGGRSSDRRSRITRSVEELAKSSISLLLRAARR